MPWDHSPQARRRDEQKYGPEYRANRRRLIAIHHGRCQKCGSTDRVQCDHINPDGGSKIENLQLLCIRCHGAKTFAQSRAWGGPPRHDPPARPSTQW